MIVDCHNCGNPHDIAPNRAKSRHHYCKMSCFKEARRRGIVTVSQPLRRAPVNGQLHCVACRKDLPETEFRRIRKGRSWSPWCVPCIRAAQRRYAAEAYRRNADPVRARKRAYKARHRESAEMEADRKRLDAYIAATDVQPRLEGWGQSQLAAMGHL